MKPIFNVGKTNTTTIIIWNGKIKITTTTTTKKIQSLTSYRLPLFFKQKVDSTHWLCDVKLRSQNTYQQPITPLKIRQEELLKLHTIQTRDEIREEQRGKTKITTRNIKREVCWITSIWIIITLNGRLKHNKLCHILTWDRWEWANGLGYKYMFMFIQHKNG